MHQLLNHNLYLVKEHVGMLKTANTYDIHGPSSGQAILHGREPKLRSITKILSFTDYKRMTPFDVLDEGAQPVCTIRGKWAGWGLRFIAGDVEFATSPRNGRGSAKRCSPAPTPTC